MCGIAGFVNFHSITPNKHLLKKMTDVISHRGPDDEGQEIIHNAALGNRRLAIIDLSPKGHMPMWDSKKRYCITYNGEIYNFQELRSELEHKNYEFKSHSDTEVIVNLFAEYGTKCFSKLRGMFALAIWDKKEGHLILARDQFGIKPLHYYKDDQVFIFGSEIKSILLHPRVRKRLNHQALSQYFSIAFGAVPSPLTMFEGVYKLNPGHYALLKKNKLDIQPFWQAITIPQQNITEHEAIELGEELIEKSVKRQLVSDVPLGSFLSGGLDSSLITAFAQKHTKHDINTFSIGFQDPDFDESSYARQVALQLHTKHHHQVFSPRQLLDVLPQIIDKLDEPLGDASILPTYLLSQFTRQYVTVALSGDGGDELFLGYPTYLIHKLSFLLNKLPVSSLGFLHQAALASSDILKLLPMAKHAGSYSMKYKIDRMFKGINPDLAIQYLNFLGPCQIDVKDNLILNHKESAVPFIKEILQDHAHGDGLLAVQLLDFILYMGEDCLVKTDRASSFNSLEVRPPFLDIETVEYALSLPVHFKLKGFTPKYILKKIAAPYLPENIINRPKKGFGVPLHAWLRMDLNSQMHELLDSEKISKQSIFDAAYVSQLMKEHESGKQDHRMLLWNLMMFQMWWEKWMK